MKKILAIIFAFYSQLTLHCSIIFINNGPSLHARVRTSDEHGTISIVEPIRIKGVTIYDCEINNFEIFSIKEQHAIEIPVNLLREDCRIRLWKQSFSPKQDIDIYANPVLTSLENAKNSHAILLKKVDLEKAKTEKLYIIYNPFAWQKFTITTHLDKTPKWYQNPMYWRDKK